MSRRSSFAQADVGGVLGWHSYPQKLGRAGGHGYNFKVLGFKGSLFAKSCLTGSLISTMIVKTPSTVPKGMNMHSTPAITRQNK